MCLPVLRNRPAGLSLYPSYMGGGGYVLSADLAAALVKLHTQVVPLKHTTAEDVTLAMWLLPFDGVRRVDHPGFRTQAGHCCAHEIERRGSPSWGLVPSGDVTRSLQDAQAAGVRQAAVQHGAGCWCVKGTRYSHSGPLRDRHSLTHGPPASPFCATAAGSA